MISAPEHFAEFLNRIGHRTTDLGLTYAYDKSPGAWLAFPFHRTFRADELLRSAVAHQRRMLLLRYSEPADGRGVDSYRISCFDRGYGLGTLSSKSRRQARRGLERCVVERIDLQQLKAPGFALFENTLERQQRPVPKGARKAWFNYFSAAAVTPGFRAWGAWADGRLVAYLLGFRMGDCFSYLRNGSDSAYLNRYPNNALVVTATAELMASEEFTEVSYGLAPLSADMPGLDSFKRNMGFQMHPIRQNVLWSSRFRSLARPLAMATRTANVLLPGRAPLQQAGALLAIATGGVGRAPDES